MRLRGRHDRRFAAYVAAGACVALAAAACSGAGGGTGSSGSITLRVAIVANPQMQDVENLTSAFEKQYPGIKVVYDTLSEDVLRSQTQKDIATNSGLFDVVMISNYESPIWANDGWLDNLSTRFMHSKLHINGIAPGPEIASLYTQESGLPAISQPVL